MQFIFDVDGTLTPSRQQIDSDFGDYFLDFCKDNKVYFVTGSDRRKTIEQLGERIYNQAVRVYNCSGNSVWEKEVCVHGKTWHPGPDLYDELIYIMRDTAYDQYGELTGRHIEGRPGCINFSIVGRNANLEERKKYVEYDEKVGERISIAERLNKKFPDLTASVGGETGIDIYPAGWDKRQVAKMDFLDCSDVYFFGDKMDEGGNDFPLAEEVTRRGGKSIAVSDWQDTWSLLKGVKSIYKGEYYEST